MPALAIFIAVLTLAGCSHPPRSVAGPTLLMPATHSPPDIDPEPKDEFKIAYPARARMKGVQGTVRMDLILDDKGRVVEARVLSGPGHGLDEAAREAIMKFTFKPAMKDGEAVWANLIYNYTFILEP